MDSEARTKLNTTTCIMHQFDAKNDRPICSHFCQHSICLDPISSDRSNNTISKYLIDNKPVGQSTEYFFEQLDSKTTCNDHKHVEFYTRKLVDILEQDLQGYISPQLKKRILHLIEISDNCTGWCEFVRRISSVFNRLLLELVQAHYNTKQREQDFIRLVKDLGCSVSEPDLTYKVVTSLTKLYKASGSCANTSYERNVLIKFLMKEIGNETYGKRQIERVVQTLYRSSCFSIEKREGSPGRLQLQETICNVSDLRHKHDEEMIKLALDNHIRLTPETWAYLLRGRNYSPDDIAKLQSLQDKMQQPVEVSELQETISKVGDKYNLALRLGGLYKFQECIADLMQKPTSIEMSCVCYLLEQISGFSDLFMIRQCRGNPSISN